MNPPSFVGRAEAVAYLQGFVRSPDAQSVSVVALPGFGRSSLLRHLAQSSTDEQTVCALVELENLRGGPDRFFEALAACLRGCVPELGPLLEEPPSEIWLEEVVEAVVARGRRLIMLWDDFQRLTRDPRFVAQFYEFFRSLASTERDFALIISSDLPLSVLARTVALEGSPFPNIFSTYSLGPLDEAEVGELVMTLLPPSARLDKREFELILELAGGCPLLVKAAVERLAEIDPAGAVTIRTSAEALEPFLATASAHCGRLWSLLTEREQRLCGEAAGPRSSIPLAEAQSLIDRGLLVWRGKRAVPSCFALKRFLLQKSGETVEFERRRPGWLRLGWTSRG